MRLLSLKINQPYRGLAGFDEDFKAPDVLQVDLQPICFVGLNGSGKSNIIEALSDIFCYLDLYCLDYEETPKWALLSPLTFDVQYLIKIDKKKKPTHIRIASKKDKAPLFYLVNDDNEAELSKEDFRPYFPKRILGYSSGQNETISFPYLRNQGFYAGSVAKQAFGKKNKQSIPHTRSLLMDYESNALILLSNFLFNKPNELKIFDEFLRISDISSFRVVVNLKLKGKQKPVLLTSELQEVIEKLIKCSVIHETISEDVHWIIDFVVNKATKDVINKTFGSAEIFFTSLYKLSLLNALSLTGQERAYYTAKGVKRTLLEQPPAVAKESKVFCVDQLKLKLSAPKTEIDYVGISDGEHQFINTIGTVMLFNEPNCLFLFDEPESHYNPLWRSQFIEILNKVSSSNDQEFVLSTHSPFVISGCRRENVLRFERKEDKNDITCSRPKRETFGNTFERLLTDLFEVESSISTHSTDRIQKIIRTKNLKKMKEAALDIAESPQKRFLYEAILRIEKNN